MRLRSDEQLVALFRSGNDEAFRVIHDRYRKRLLAYTRQMLAGSGQDAEDVLQDVLERAYRSLRGTDRELALKAWLYRIAHNRCIDQVRRPLPVTATTPDETESRQLSPIAVAEQRETLRRLIADIQRLPDQQRSALLLREMSGMSYADLAGAMGVSVPAIKSLLVRARIGLVAASEARDTACSAIREELVLCHDRGVRPSGLARRHLRDCQQCNHFKRSVRGVGRDLAAISPAAGPLGILIKLLGGGSAASSGGVLGSSTAAAGGATVSGAAGGVAGGSAVVSTGALAGGLAAGTATHVVTLMAAAALVTAGGAMAVQQAATPAAARSHPLAAHHLGKASIPYSGGAGIAPAGSVASHSVGQGRLAAQRHSLSAAATKSAHSGRADHARRRHHALPTTPSSAGTEGPSSSAVSSSSTGPAGTTTPTSSTTTPPPAASPGSSTSTQTTSATDATTPSTQSTGGAAISPPDPSGDASGATSDSTSGS